VKSLRICTSAHAWQRRRLRRVCARDGGENSCCVSGEEEQNTSTNSHWLCARARAACAHRRVVVVQHVPWRLDCVRSKSKGVRANKKRKRRRMRKRKKEKEREKEKQEREREKEREGESNKREREKKERERETFPHHRQAESRCRPGRRASGLVWRPAARTLLSLLMCSLCEYSASAENQHTHANAPWRRSTESSSALGPCGPRSRAGSFQPYSCWYSDGIGAVSARQRQTANK
jgi:hypothetical protein